MSNYVAVYGTLRQGEGNHSLLGMESAESGTIFIGKGLTVDHANMYRYTVNGGFPVLEFTSPAYTRATVELYQVNAATLARLDNLEGHPRFYTRELRDVEVEGAQYKAWVYAINDWSSRIGDSRAIMLKIPSCDWTKRSN